MCVSVCVCVCAHMCVCTCMYAHFVCVSMHVCVCVCMFHTCMCMYSYVCLQERGVTCMCMCVCVYIPACTLYVCVHACMCVCMCVCVCVCVDSNKLFLCFSSLDHPIFIPTLWPRNCEENIAWRWQSPASAAFWGRAFSREQCIRQQYAPWQWHSCLQCVWNYRTLLLGHTAVCQTS